MSDKKISGRLRSGTAWLAAGAMLVALALHPQPGFARARSQGAIVSVATTTGGIQGELIGVREDAVVVMGRQESSTIPVAEIESVRIIKHSATLGLALLGFAVGGGVGALAAPRIHDDDSIPEGLCKAFEGAGAICLGALVGTAVGVTSALAIGKDKVIVFKGKTKGEIARALEGLKKHARVPDYK
jgi:hypothetical protein